MSRNDLYFVIERGDFERGGKSSSKNVEVTVTVLDETGRIVQVPFVFHKFIILRLDEWQQENRVDHHHPTKNSFFNEQEFRWRWKKEMRCISWWRKDDDRRPTTASLEKMLSSFPTIDAVVYDNIRRREPAFWMLISKRLSLFLWWSSMNKSCT